MLLRHMTQQTRPYARAKRVFLLLFLISTILFGLFTCFAVLGLWTSPVPCLGCPISPTPPGSLQIELLLPLMTFLTSVTTLIGFISTTWLAWRKEKREARMAALDVRREEIELEKARLELEKLKLEREPQSKTKSKQ